MDNSKLVGGIIITGGLVGLGILFSQGQKKKKLIDSIMTLGQLIPNFDGSRVVLEKMTIQELENILAQVQSETTNIPQ